jgi:hypothetical protein
MYQRWLYCDEAVRRITTCCIVVCCSAMYGAVAWRGVAWRGVAWRGVAWRGTAGPLGCVCCGVDGVGSARQAFLGASAFNQNIGSWNTASVSIMEQCLAFVRALVPSHACGAQPTSLSQQWSRVQVVPGAVVVPAQMWGWPTSDVGESRFVWACPGADVGEAWLNCERILKLIPINDTCCVLQ